MNADSRSEAPLRERLREATRDAILRAAESTFADRGVHAARMEDVAARAGVAVGTLYNYFADKQGIVRALLEARRAELLARLDATPADRATFAERLTTWIAAALEHFDAHRPLFAVLVEEDVDPTHCARARTSTLGELAARSRRLVREGIAAGALRADDADLHADLLVGLVRAAVTRALHGKSHKPIAAVAPRIARLFMSGAQVEGESSCKRPRRH